MLSNNFVTLQMIPVIIIIFSSLILVFSVLRTKSAITNRAEQTNLEAYYGLKPNTNNSMRIKTILDAAMANLKQRDDCFSKKHIIRQLYNQRLLSPKHWHNLEKLVKDLEYEQLVIEAEAELLKPDWNIFNEANRMLPLYKKKEEKVDKENRFKENSFLLKKKETLENQLMARLTALPTK